MTPGTETLRIGTRRSRLAMWQAQTVADRLKTLFPDISVTLVPVSTEGDRDRATALGEFARTGIFTREIEDGLLRGQFDVAVHSYKDLATESPVELEIAAVLEREDPRDAFVSRWGVSLRELPEGSIIGTSSMRRRSMILACRPDLVVVPLRGNVPTRLRAAGVLKEEGAASGVSSLDGAILALAGLRRLGYHTCVTEILSPPLFLPAPAQGAIAVQVRRNDETTGPMVRLLDHGPTRVTTCAEREFMREMEGGCQLPLGALGHLTGDDLRLDAVVLNLDGTRRIADSAEGRVPEALARALSQKMKDAGADALLREVKAASVTPP